MGVLEDYFKKEKIVWDKLESYIKELYGELPAKDIREQYLRMSIAEHEKPTLEEYKETLKYIDWTWYMADGQAYYQAEKGYNKSKQKAIDLGGEYLEAFNNYKQ